MDGARHLRGTGLLGCGGLSFTAGNVVCLKRIAFDSSTRRKSRLRLLNACHTYCCRRGAAGKVQLPVLLCFDVAMVLLLSPGVLLLLLTASPQYAELGLFLRARADHQVPSSPEQSITAITTYLHVQGTKYRREVR